MNSAAINLATISILNSSPGGALPLWISVPYLSILIFALLWAMYELYKTFRD